MRLLILPTVALIFAGCATFDQREISYLRSAGVPPNIVYKLDHGKPLTPPEIITLSQRGVPEHFILRHLDHNGVNYLVTKADILRMRNAGVSARVIDALILECEEFARLYAEPDVVVSSGFWWADSPYYGPDLYYSGW